LKSNGFLLGADLCENGLFPCCIDKIFNRESSFPPIIKYRWSRYRWSFCRGYFSSV